MEDLLLEITRLRAENETLSSEVETLSSENEAKSARIGVLSFQLDAKSAENDALQAKTRRMAQRIAYLERMLYGAKSDKLAKQAIDQPTLFDGLFNEAMDERDKAIADTAEEIKKEGEARRAKAKTQPSRPSKYQYTGLEEHTTVLMPEGVNPDEYDIIGKDITRILHRQAAKVRVEVVYPKNVIRNGSMLFLMAAIRKIHWQDVATQDISNFVAQKLSQL